MYPWELGIGDFVREFIDVVSFVWEIFSQFFTNQANCFDNAIGKAILLEMFGHCLSHFVPESLRNLFMDSYVSNHSESSAFYVKKD